MRFGGHRRCLGARCGAARRPASAAAAAPRAAPGRRAALDVACKQGAGRRAGGKGRASTKKGFAKPSPKVLAEPWEAELPPYYRAYYKAGFKPPRFTGPIELEAREGGCLPLYWLSRSGAPRARPYTHGAGTPGCASARLRATQPPRCPTTNP